MKKIKKAKSENAGDYFDDCLVCQAMKKMEETGEDLTVEELETVFAKQNLKNKLKDE